MVKTYKKKHLVLLISLVCFCSFSLVLLYTRLHYTENNKDNFPQQLHAFISAKFYSIKHISVYYYSFDTNQEVIINDKYKYIPASLQKVPIMIAYLKLAQVYPKLLQYPLSYTSKDSNPYLQNIPPQQSIIDGKLYTVDELIQRMIAYSDNKATNVLFDHFNTFAISKVYSDLGIAHPDITNTNYSLSVSEYAKIFKALYKEDYLNKAMSQRALQYLEKSKYKDGLLAGIPSDIPVADKFAERTYANNQGKQLHECGIIYASKPYLLCVMTEGNDLNQQALAIRNISQFVYQNGNEYSIKNVIANKN